MDNGLLVRPILVFSAVVLTGVFLLLREENSSGSDNVPTPHPVVSSAVTSRATDEPFQWDFPDRAKIHFDTPGSRGWKQTGEFPLDFDSSDDLVKDLMRRRGYEEKHRVPDSQLAGRFLSQWESPGGKKILWTLWRIQGNRTGFSWGESK